jgi:hypothetical protein
VPVRGRLDRHLLPVAEPKPGDIEQVMQVLPAEGVLELVVRHDGCGCCCVVKMYGSGLLPCATNA